MLIYIYFFHNPHLSNSYSIQQYPNLPNYVNSHSIQQYPHLPNYVNSFFLNTNTNIYPIDHISYINTHNLPNYVNSYSLNTNTHIYPTCQFLYLNYPVDTSTSIQYSNTIYPIMSTPIL